MTIEPRARGRPARGDGEVGRIRLLESTRAALKAKPRLEMQRREIAAFAGVTPALVSYYFPDKWHLFAAAAKPVIEAYVSNVRDVLRDKAGPVIKIRALAYVFMEFNYEQGHLLDFYLEHSLKIGREDDLRQLREIYEAILSFFGDLIRDGTMRAESPAFIQSALWGLCKYVAQQPHLEHFTTSNEKAQMLRSQADSVCDLFLNGVSTSPQAVAGGRSAP